MKWRWALINVLPGLRCGKEMCQDDMHHSLVSSLHVFTRTKHACKLRYTNTFTLLPAPPRRAWSVSGSCPASSSVSADWGSLTGDDTNSTLHRLGLHVWAISSCRPRGLRMQPRARRKKADDPDSQSTPGSGWCPRWLRKKGLLRCLNLKTATRWWTPELCSKWDSNESLFLISFNTKGHWCYRMRCTIILLAVKLTSHLFFFVKLSGLFNPFSPIFSNFIYLHQFFCSSSLSDIEPGAFALPKSDKQSMSHSNVSAAAISGLVHMTSKFPRIHS